MRVVLIVFNLFSAGLAGGDNAGGGVAPREDDRIHPILDGSQSLEPVFAIVVPAVLRNYASRIQERPRGIGEVKTAAKFWR